VCRLGDHDPVVPQESTAVSLAQITDGALVIGLIACVVALFYTQARITYWRRAVELVEGRLAVLEAKRPEC
jgi:hypothetical protein